MNKCLCGCGLGVNKQWAEGHYRKGRHFPNEDYSSRSGVKNHNWKGGQALSTEGYILTHQRGHPNANKQGYIYEHRYVMEQHLGRYLETWEVVHHKNKIKTDNRISNLELMTKGKHNSLHFKMDTSDRSCFLCLSKTTYLLRGKHWWYRHPITKQEWICRKCRERIVARL